MTAVDLLRVVGPDDPREPVLRLSGDLDADSAAGLDPYVVAALASAPPSLVIDLAEVGFVDSVGVSALLKAYNRGAGQQVTVRLRAPRPLVENALRVLGLLDLFGLRPSR